MTTPRTLPERFWSLAHAGDGERDESIDPVDIVDDVLAILDALDRGEKGDDVDDEAARLLEELSTSQENELGSYAAPERVGDEELDTRSMVFSVGVLIFERLTGRHPFGAESNQSRQMARMRRGEFGSGVNYFPQIPPGLRSILRRAMGPFPEERFQTLGEMRGELESFVATERRGDGELPTRRAGPGCRADTAELTTSGQVDRPIEDEPSVEVRLEAEPSRRRADTAEERPRHGRPQREVGHRAASPRADDPGGRTTSHIASRAGWLAAGVAVGAAAVYLLMPPRDGDAPTGAATKGVQTSGDDEAAIDVAPVVDGDEAADQITARGPEPNLQAATAPEPAPPAEPPPEPQPEPVPPPEPAPEPEPPPEPEPALDPEASGNRAAALARGCFTDEQLAAGVDFGLSIGYDRGGGVGKLYFASPTPLKPADKRCLRDTIGAMPVRGKPEAMVVVQYRMVLDANGEEVAAKLPR